MEVGVAVTGRERHATEPIGDKPTRIPLVDGTKTFLRPHDISQ